jgi:peptide/nickel transport system substrate-binding protein
MLLALGCGEPAASRPGLVVALSSAPQSLDPRFGTDANSARVADLLHAGLTRADATARRVPDLAASWETPDPTTMVFHLRDGFRFSDGTPVTAADVVATYRAVLDPAVGSPKRAAVAMLASVDSPAPRTVVFRARAPFAPLLDATGIGILPAAHARDRGEVTIGAGPYRLERAVRGEELVLTPNPGHPDGRARIDPLVVRTVPDEVVRVLELGRGGIDLLEDTPEPELVDWLRRVPRLEVRRGPGTSFDYLALNLRDPRLADRRVRRAIAFAIGRAALVEYVLGGAARLATGMLAPEHWAYAPAHVPRYDPARARRLLDRAGYPDPDGAGPRPRFRLVYKTSNQPGRRRLAEAIQADLAAVGIGVDVRTYEWGTLYADIRRGNFQLCALAWVGVGDPDLYYLTLHSTMQPPAGYNRGAYVDPVMDRLTARGRRTLEPAHRRAIYARIQRRAAHELPVIPLWWADRIVIHPRRLEGFEPAPDGNLRGLAVATLR